MTKIQSIFQHAVWSRLSLLSLIIGACVILSVQTNSVISSGSAYHTQIPDIPVGYYAYTAHPSNISVPYGNFSNANVSLVSERDYSYQIIESTNIGQPWEIFYRTRILVAYEFEPLQNVTQLHYAANVIEFRQGYATGKLGEYNLRLYNNNSMVWQCHTQKLEDMVYFEHQINVTRIELRAQSYHWDWEQGYSLRLSVDVLELTAWRKNQAPQFTIQPSIFPQFPRLGENLSVNYEYKDQDGSFTPCTVSIEWQKKVNSELVTLPNSNRTELTLNADHFTIGDQICVRIGIQDSLNASVMAYSSWVSIQNTAPEVITLSLESNEEDPSIIYATSTLTASITSFDADGSQTLTSEFRWWKNTTLLQNWSVVNYLMLTAADVDANDLIWCDARVFDGIEYSGIKTINFTVQNRAPVFVGNVSLMPGSPTIMDDLTVWTEIYDSDNDPLDIIYTWWQYRAGSWAIVQQGAWAMLSYMHHQLNDVYYVNITVSDGFSIVTARSPNVTIVNSAPTISEFSYQYLDASGNLISDPAAIIRTSQIAISVNLTDPDVGQALFVITELWTNLGQLLQSQNFSILANHIQTLIIDLDGWVHHGETIFVKLIAWDSVSQGDTITTQPVLIQNAMPMIHGITFENNPPVKASYLKAWVNFTDIDLEDSCLIEYRWKINNLTEPALCSNLLPAYAITHGDQVMVSVRIGNLWNDTISWTEWVDSSLLIIRNQVPIITNIEFTTALSSQSLIPSISAFDPEGDLFTYYISWRVNDQIVLDWNASYLPCDYFTRGDIVKCIIWAIDSYNGEWSQPVNSSQIRIQNSLPKITGWAMNPEKIIFTDDIIHLTVNASDYEHDNWSIVVAWFRNGDLIKDASSLELNSSFFVAGDTITAEIRAVDAYGNSDIIRTDLVIIALGTRSHVFDWAKLLASPKSMLVLYGGVFASTIIVGGVYRQIMTRRRILKGGLK